MDYLYRIESILEDGEAVVSEMIAAPGGSAEGDITDGKGQEKGDGSIFVTHPVMPQKLMTRVFHYARCGPSPYGLRTGRAGAGSMKGEGSAPCAVCLPVCSACSSVRG